MFRSIIGPALAAIWIAAATDLPAQSDAGPGPAVPAATKVAAAAPVDRLIPWLLDEDKQLRGIPFSEVIADVTGKKVLPFQPDAEVDQRIVKAITAACE